MRTYPPTVVVSAKHCPSGSPPEDHLLLHAKRAIGIRTLPALTCRWKTCAHRSTKCVHGRMESPGCPAILSSRVGLPACSAYKHSSCCPMGAWGS